MPPSHLPLSGRTIMLTRPQEQSVQTMRDVERLGGTPLLFPCLSIELLPDSVRAALVDLAEFDTLLFTSSNGVRAVVAAGIDPSLLCEGKHIAAVGAQTAAALRQAGIACDLFPEEQSQEGLLAALQSRGFPRHLLFFRAAEGRDHLMHQLQHAGVSVRMVAAYRTTCPTDDPARIRALLAADAVDAVLLGSSKTVRHYFQRIGDPHLACRPLIVAISRQVADVAEQLGPRVAIVAKTASFPAMLDALSGYYLSLEHS